MASPLDRSQVLVHMPMSSRPQNIAMALCALEVVYATNIGPVFVMGTREFRPSTRGELSTATRMRQSEHLAWTYITRLQVLEREIQYGRRFRRSYQPNLSELAAACGLATDIVQLVATPPLLKASPFLPVRVDLSVSRLQETNSAVISLEGLGDAIQPMINALDPLTRRERREALRNLQARNDIDERVARSDASTTIIENALKTAQALVDGGVIPSSAKADTVRTILGAQVGAETFLDTLRIEQAGPVEEISEASNSHEDSLVDAYYPNDNSDNRQ